MRPRVLFLQHEAMLGGAELQLVDIATRFRTNSSVLLFTNGPLRDRLAQAGVPVRVVPSAWATTGLRGDKPHWDLSTTLSVCRLAVIAATAARRHDLLYANTPRALLVAALAGKLGRRPVIWALHDMLCPSHFSASGIRLVVRAAQWGAERILACSSAAAAAFIDQGGPADRTHVVHNGFNGAHFASNPCTVTRLRQELGLADGPVAGLFGRVTEWKGQHVGVALLARIPELQLLLAGDASDKPYTAALLRRAEELNVSGRLRLLGHRDDIADLMRVCDVVLHTSVAPEPFGRVIVEAMLADRPVIATTGGGVAEIVQHGVNGLLVPPGDVDALTGMVRMVLHDRALASQLVKAGSEQARSRFTLQAMLDRQAWHISAAAGGSHA